MRIFVCDMCNHVDLMELAYPGQAFYNGPPPVWCCTMCQGRPWHNQMPRRLYDGVEPVINRASSGTTTSVE